MSSDNNKIVIVVAKVDKKFLIVNIIKYAKVATGVRRLSTKTEWFAVFFETFS